MLCFVVGQRHNNGEGGLTWAGKGRFFVLIKYFLYFWCFKSKIIMRSPTVSFKTIRVVYILLFLVLILCFIFQYHIPKHTFRSNVLFTIIYSASYIIFFSAIKRYNQYNPHPKALQRILLVRVFFLVVFLLQITMLWVGN